MATRASQVPQRRGTQRADIQYYGPPRETEWSKPYMSTSLENSQGYDHVYWEMETDTLAKVQGGSVVPDISAV